MIRPLVGSTHVRKEPVGNSKDEKAPPTPIHEPAMSGLPPGLEYLSALLRVEDERVRVSVRARARGMRKNCVPARKRRDSRDGRDTADAAG